MKPLADTVAVVAGATRGAGRGIAHMLGEAGATVYCTGRGSRATPSAVGPYAGRAETIDETAALVDAAGGRGIPVRVDHGDAAQVATLVERIHRDHGRIDVLVNVLGGAQLEDMRPFWELPLDAGHAFVDAWLWPHAITARHVLPGMVARGAGLVVEVLEGDTLGYHRQVWFDLAVIALKRLSYGWAEELAPHGVTSLVVAPGFMRTEVVLDHLHATEETWRTVAGKSKAARAYGFAGSETPCFVGRAIAALAADPDVLRLSGGMYGTWTLAERYGFTDVDGARPHWWHYLREHFPQLALAKPATGKEWVVAG